MKRLLWFLCLVASTSCMEEKLPVKNIFIDSKLENNVRIFTKKINNEDLDREDYISYLKVANKEMFQDVKFVVRFLGSFRGMEFEVLKEPLIKRKSSFYASKSLNDEKKNE